MQFYKVDINNIKSAKFSDNGAIEKIMYNFKF